MEQRTSRRIGWHGHRADLAEWEADISPDSQAWIPGGGARWHVYLVHYHRWREAFEKVVEEMAY